MAAEDARVLVPQQFENPENPRVHYEKTATELWRQMDASIDGFVAGPSGTSARRCCSDCPAKLGACPAKRAQDVLWVVRPRTTIFFAQAIVGRKGAKKMG